MSGTPEITERIARFLCEEQQLRYRSGPFWNDLSIAQKNLWREDADRFHAHMAERGLTIVEST